MVNSKPLIETLNSLARNTSGLKVIRKLQTKIEIETPTGETISIHDHPRNTKVEVWDGKSWEILNTGSCQMRAANQGETITTSWGRIVKATRKINRQLIFNNDIKTLKFENGLFIINDWIALKTGV